MNGPLSLAMFDDTRWYINCGRGLPWQLAQNWRKLPQKADHELFAEPGHSEDLILPRLQKVLFVWYRYFSQEYPLVIKDGSGKSLVNEGLHRKITDMFHGHV